MFAGLDQISSVQNMYSASVTFAAAQPQAEGGDSPPLVSNADAPPHVYSFDFGDGMGPWNTWMAPSVVREAGGEHEAFTRLNAPGLLDPNHLDGIGALRLVAHLSLPAPGSPGVLNLTDAEFEITIRATDFEANGAQLMVWICRYVPEEGVFRNFYVPLVANNWANTANDMTSQLVEGEWRTITVRLSDDPADWTYAGENHTQQGDWADRYQPYDLAETLAQTDATLHLVMINAEPDDAPTGFLDIANITVRTQTPATPLDRGAATRDVFNGLEDQPVEGSLLGDGVVDLDNATFSLVEGSTRNGTVTLDPATGAFVFTPDADFRSPAGPSGASGAASFRYVVTDGVNTTERTAYINIGSLNDRPTATTVDESVEIAADTPFASALRIGTDVDAYERLTYRVVEGATDHGTVTIDPSNGRYIFIPDAGFSGQASFSYVVSDGQLDSEPQTVTLTVLPSGQQPDRLDLSGAGALLGQGDIEGFVRSIILLADAGDANAATFYGQWLRYGLYVPQDAKLAAQYLELARGRSAESDITLADMYATGNGVDKDAAEARAILETLPVNARALYQLAILQERGYGGPADSALAVETYLTAAWLGSADAMFALGRRYLAGEGVPASAQDAYYWLSVALARNGGTGTQQYILQLNFNIQQAIDMGLTPAQRQALDASVAAWRVGQVASSDQAPILGSLGRDLLVGTVGNDVIFGGTGAPDELYGGLGDDLYILESTDTVVEFAGGGYDTVEARIGSHTLRANVERLIFTGTGNFVGTGNASDNVLIGGEGDDVLRGRGGDDLIDGGLGRDTADYSQAVAGVTVRLDRGQTIIDGDGGSDTLVSIENITGSEFNDLIIGDDGANVIRGGSGRDVLIGQAGNDTFVGGLGAPDEIYGGLGNDVFILDSSDTVVELEGQGIDTVQARIGSYRLSAHVENLTYIGTGFFNGWGNELNNRITGGAGDDLLRGMGGNDIIDGGAGTDTLYLRGLAADYTITAEGDGWRIVDGVAGRDGSTFVTRIERLGYADGSLQPLLMDAASATTAKDADGPQTFPGVVDDDVLPLVTPSDAPSGHLQRADQTLPIVMGSIGFETVETGLDLTPIYHSGLMMLDRAAVLLPVPDPWA